MKRRNCFSVKIPWCFDGDLVQGEEVELELHCDVYLGFPGSYSNPPEPAEVNVEKAELLCRGKGTGKFVEIPDDVFEKHYGRIEEAACLAAEEAASDWYDDYEEPDDI